MAGIVARTGQVIVNALWRARFGPPDAARKSSRSFAGAQNGRLFSNWVTQPVDIDQYIRSDWFSLVARSRELFRNNDYAKGFSRIARRNIIGRGVKMQALSVLADDTPDKIANQERERAWKAWGRVGVTTVCGRFSWLDVQHLVVTVLPRDGEILIREHLGFRNGHGYALELIRPEVLDMQLSRELPNGGEIRMGVERDRWKRPVAYHLLTRDAVRSQRRHERVPADQIIHLFVPEDPDQTRGIPWMVSTMRRLKMLGGYEEAALVAARTGASKVGFYQDAEGRGFAPDAEDPETGAPISEAEPGHFEVLPVGMEFKGWDPNYPDGEMPGFIKAMLRGGATGLGISYNGWANDLEGVNFSSLRGGLIEERDEWMILQDWLIERFHDRVHRNCQSQALLFGSLNLPIAEAARFEPTGWIPRRWKWVDPEKEGKANARDVAMGVTSRTRIAAEQGRDLEEVFDELAREEDLAKEKGITLAGPNELQAAAGKDPKLTEDGDTENDDEEETDDEDADD